MLIKLTKPWINPYIGIPKKEINIVNTNIDITGIKTIEKMMLKGDIS